MNGRVARELRKRAGHGTHQQEREYVYVSPRRAKKSGRVCYLVKPVERLTYRLMKRAYR